jgi:glycosyltransferase involved in cell wall biosynthesis
LIKNHEKTIQQALQSVVTLGATILVGDRGSKDGSLSICKEFNAKIIPVPQNDYALARNNLIKNTQTTWTFVLQPWEVLANGHRHLTEITEKSGNSHMCQVFQGDIIAKEIRLFSKGEFSNPVYETIHDPLATLVKEIIIYNRGDTSDEYVNIITEWKKKNPASPNPYYYEACILLQQRNYNKFISIANHYLFQERQGMSAVMLKYYLAMVYCYYLKDLKSALFHLVPCLAVCPLMAEFWCVLGDISYKQNNYDKAKIFYENAVVLGSHRNMSDEWPIDISKYKKYPQKMIENCLKLIKESQYYK